MSLRLMRIPKSFASLSVVPLLEVSVTLNDFQVNASKATTHESLFFSTRIEFALILNRGTLNKIVELMLPPLSEST